MTQWRTIPRFEGRYEASDEGTIRSLVRGTPRLLKATPGTTDRLRVTLYQDGKKAEHFVHRLVCEAFHGPSPEGKPLALHKNGNHRDNRPENLYWGDHRDNARDTVRHGRSAFRAVDKCSRGHLKTEETWYIRPGGTGGTCKICADLRRERYRRQELDERDPRHGTIDAYFRLKCRCGRCVEAAKTYRRERWGAALPEGDLRHGLTGAFNYKCKCDICLKAAREHYRKQREKRTKEGE